MSKITIDFPTDDKHKALHTLDGLVQIFNHWYGGWAEYTLKATSFEGKTENIPNNDKAEAFDQIKVLVDEEYNRAHPAQLKMPIGIFLEKLTSITSEKRIPEES